MPQQAAYQRKKKSLLYSIYDDVTRSTLVSNVVIESVGSAGFTYQAFI